MGFGINNDGNINKVGQTNNIFGTQKIQKTEFINSAFTARSTTPLNHNFTEEQTNDFALLNHFANLPNFLLNED